MKIATAKTKLLYLQFNLAQIAVKIYEGANCIFLAKKSDARSSFFVIEKEFERS